MKRGRFNARFRLAAQYGHVTSSLRVRGALLAVGLAAAVAITACTAGRPSAIQASAYPAATANHGKTGARAGARAGALAARRTASAVPVAVEFSRVRAPDGSVIMIATFRGPVRYVLHDGSQDPGRLAGPVTEGPKITGPSRARLLAAFNGGFKMTSLAGGYEQEGHVARPLLTGLASLVIDRSGQARIGVWGQTVPTPGEAVYSVRQNLWLLVSGGRPTAQSARWWRWGWTLGHFEFVARSALGENAAGELMYAASMFTTPADLARALASHGARVAMELDINPEWVQMDAARRPGGRLAAEVPGQHRPADQYLVGWTRDFIAVLAPPAH
jgi:hypothetical protein